MLRAQPYGGIDKDLNNEKVTKVHFVPWKPKYKSLIFSSSVTGSREGQRELCKATKKAK